MAESIRYRLVRTNRDERTPPSRWLLKWMREEKFWQDVTTRALAAIIVIFLSYLYAILAGYVRQPNVWRSLLSALVLAALVALAIVHVRWVMRQWQKGPHATDVGWPIYSPRLLVLITEPFVLGLAAALIYGASRLFQALWG
jgi:hypothetical protein